MANALDTLIEAMKIFIRENGASRVYEVPSPGGSGKVVLAAGVQKVPLSKGSCVILCAVGGDALIGFDCDPTNPANAYYLPSGGQVAFVLRGQFNSIPTIQAIQGPTAGGTLYYSVVE